MRRGQHIVDHESDGLDLPVGQRAQCPGERVIDIGSGAGFDSFIAAHQVGETGRVVGVDMTAEMLTKSRDTASALQLANVEFREGLAEAAALGLEPRPSFLLLADEVIR